MAWGNRQHACCKALFRILAGWAPNYLQPELDEKGCQSLGVYAGLGADDSDCLCRELLEVTFHPLPDNAAQLQDLLESGKVVVTQVGPC